MPSPSNAVRPSSATAVASLRGDGYPEAPRDAPAPATVRPDVRSDDPSGDPTDDTLASAPRTPARVVKDVERVGERPEDASKVANRRAAVYEADDAEANDAAGVTVSVSVFAVDQGSPEVVRSKSSAAAEGSRTAIDANSLRRVSSTPPGGGSRGAGARDGDADGDGDGDGDGDDKRRRWEEELRRDLEAQRAEMRRGVSVVRAAI